VRPLEERHDELLLVDEKIARVLAFRAEVKPDADLEPVARLLQSTVDTVRGYISCNGAVRMGPSGTIPRGLVIPAMDYAMGKVLNRIGVPLTDDRRKALEAATALFEKISQGAITPESYAENGQLDEGTRPANAPVFAPAHPERLLD